MNLEQFREQQEKGFNAPCLIHQNTSTGAVYVLIDNTDGGELKVEVKRYILDRDNNWTVGFLYAGDDYVCAMDKFRGCLNTAVVDTLKGLKFTCPECGRHRIECCQDGYHVSEVLCIDEDGDHDYAGIQSHGEVLRWQCGSCGYVLEFSGDITDNVEMAQWVKENCEQPPEVKKK